MAPPRILHELGQRLSGLLETGLSTPGEAPVPVFLCHPLDPIDDRRDSPSGAFGVLYPTSVAPDPRYRHAAPRLERDTAVEGLGERLRRPPLWLRVRYVFLVAGGDSHEQLVALGGAIQVIHDTPEIELVLTAAEGSDPEESGEPSAAETVCLPLMLVDSSDGWRELGLAEHRLTIAFEVSCPIRSARTELVRRTEEREVRVEAAPLGGSAVRRSRS